MTTSTDTSPAEPATTTQPRPLSETLEQAETQLYEVSRILAEAATNITNPRQRADLRIVLAHIALTVGALLDVVP